MNPKEKVLDMFRFVPGVNGYWVFWLALMLGSFGLPSPTFAQDKNKEAERFAEFTENVLRQTINLGGIPAYFLDKDDFDYGTAVALLRMKTIFSPSVSSQSQADLLLHGYKITLDLVKAHPKDLNIRFLFAEYRFELGKLLASSAHGIGIFSQLQNILGNWIAEAPHEPRQRELLARCVSFIANLDLRQNPQRSAQDSRKAIEQWEYLIKNHGPKGRYLVGLSYDYTGLTSALEFLGEKEEIEELDQKALELRQKLVERYPQQAAQYVDLGGSQCNVANHKYEIAHKHDQAWNGMRSRSELLKERWNSIPMPSTRKTISTTLIGVECWFILTSRSMPKLMPNGSDRRRRSHRRTCRAVAYIEPRNWREQGRGQEAVREADELAKQAKRLPDRAILFALTYTLACNSFRDNPKTLERCQEQAVLWLGVFADHESNQNEVFLQHLKVFKDFELLRNRKDFQELLKKIEKAIPKPKEPAKQ